MVKLCLSSDVVEGRSRGISLDDKNLFLVRRDEVLYGYLNACPHLGVPLNWTPHDFLDSENELIQCSTHGALFLIDTGECVSGPCVRQFLQPIQLVEKNGEIFLVDIL